MKQIIVELTDAQYKALSYVAYDPTEWVQNFVNVRCKTAMKQIFDEQVEKITNEGGTISGNIEQVVLEADIKSAKEFTDEAGSTPPPPMPDLL